MSKLVHHHVPVGSLLGQPREKDWKNDIYDGYGWLPILMDRCIYIYICIYIYYRMLMANPMYIYIYVIYKLIGH